MTVLLFFVSVPFKRSFSKTVKLQLQLIRFNISILSSDVLSFKVNLDAETKEKTRQNVESPCSSCFVNAQKMIYTLMEKDSYRRFLNSKLIQDLGQTRSTTDQDNKKKKKNYDCAKNGQPVTGGA